MKSLFIVIVGVVVGLGFLVPPVFPQEASSGPNPIGTATRGEWESPLMPSAGTIGQSNDSSTGQCTNPDKNWQIPEGYGNMGTMTQDEWQSPFVPPFGIGVTLGGSSTSQCNNPYENRPSQLENPAHHASVQPSGEPPSAGSIPRCTGITGGTGPC